MKKLIVIALAVVMALSVVAFAACGGSETVEGEYSYANAWNPAQKYGAKVKVTVKGGVITSVELLADTDSFFNLSAGWTDEGKANWNDNKAAFLSSFEGLSVDDVNAINVACDTETVGSADTYFSAVKGQPKTITGAPESLKVVTGATQSSGRLILAVQNALAKLGTTSAEGAISINTVREGHDYQAKVKVYVKDGKIVLAELQDLDEGKEWSTGDRFGNKDSVQDWVNANVVGKTVEVVNGWQVDITKDSANAIVSADVLKDAAGATTTGSRMGETCARVIAAIQDALAKLAA